MTPGHTSSTELSSTEDAAAGAGSWRERWLAGDAGGSPPRYR
jgi:hypothetical protein